MSVSGALSSRRAVRAYRPDPLPAGLLDGLLDRARRTPTAGNCQGVEFLVLDQPDAVATYWATTLAEERRASFPWPGLLKAPALVAPFGLPERYLERYGEADKVASGLGSAKGEWPVPYWLTDAAFAAMALQLLAVEEGLGCCFFGMFEHEAAVRERFGVPGSARSPGVVALGWPDGVGERASGSASRGRRHLGEVVHRGSW